MAAQARTLLAKLGFADADRKNPRHDRACNYLCLRPGALAAAVAAGAGPGFIVNHAKGDPERQVLKGDGKYATTVGFIDVFADFEATFEVDIRCPVEPIPNGLPSFDERRDAAVRAHPTFSRFPRDERGHVCPPPAWEHEYRNWEYADFGPYLEEQRAADAAIKPKRDEARRLAPRCKIGAYANGQAIVEVKIGFVSSGDLIRQMRVYREFTKLKTEQTRFATPSEWRDSPSDIDNGSYLSAVRAHTAKAFEARMLRTQMVAVVDYETDDEYVGACKLAGISIVRLGAGFEAFLNEERKSGGVPEL